MTFKSQIYPGSIGFFLIWLQNLKTCLTLNTIELQEMDYLANHLSPEECFQLYNLLDHRHVNRVETLRYVHKRNQAIPCFNLLAAWSTDPDESDYKDLDRVALKLAKINRKDLALWLDRGSIHRRDETNLSHNSGAKELDDMSNTQIIHEAVLGDERLQRSTCPSKTSGRMKFFWKVFFVALIILILLLLCVCCYRCIYAKLRCMCSRIEFKQCGDKEEKEEKYCLCTGQHRTSSFEDSRTNKKDVSHFKKVVSTFKHYFKNRKEKKKEKLRCQKFQKLKKKLQKMYIDQRKEVRVNRQEERILNSLTEEERDELGEMIREMKFLLDSDEETERLLLSGKHQGTFIIDMKNLRHPKITPSHESNQDIKTIKKWESRDRLSTSVSEEMMVSCTAETKTHGNESTRSTREKKNLQEPNGIRKKPCRGSFGNESSDYITKKESPIFKIRELDVKSEFVKCYAISDSDKNFSSPVTWKRNKRCSLELEGKSNFSTSEETDFSTFRSEDHFENFQNLSSTLAENKKEIQSDMENRKKDPINIKKSGSAIELGSKKSTFESRFRFQKKRTNKANSEQNRGDYSENNKNKRQSNEKKKVQINSSRTSLDSTSSWSFTPRYSKINSEKSNEHLPPFKNSDHGDAESQLDLCETYDELGMLFSQHMKQQSRPCYRKYCLLRRHLKQRIHDQRQCRFKKNYFQYYPNGQAPSCSSGNICRDTYDEFNLMRATPRERKKIRQAVYKRRKEFLDQPCVSPGRQIFQMFSG